MKTTRREFLHKTALAMAIPAVIPARLLGQNAPSKRINVLMLGCGRQAYNSNLPTLMGFPEVRIGAICDVDKWRADKGKAKVDEKYGNTDCQVFADYRQALAMEGLDAVMISTPDHWHVLHCLEAIKKGLHVSCEKPLTRHLAEGRMVADAAKKRRALFSAPTPNAAPKHT